MGELLRKAQNREIKDMLDGVLQHIQSITPDPDDKSKGMDEVLDYLDGLISNLQGQQHRKEKGWDFSAEKCAPIFTEDEQIILRTFAESDREFYLKVCEDSMHHLDYTEIQDEINASIWDKAIRDQSFYCIVEDKSIGRIGYIGIKDTTSNLWEIAIEFEAQFCHKGYGTRALPLFLRRINEITGEDQFQALVEVDNIASQKLMTKLGGELIDIYDFIFKDEDRADSYEAEHLDMITDHMRQLAAQLDIEPRKLLSHVLDYRLYVHE